MSRLRYAIVGTGARARMYIEAMVGAHADRAELVAWADANPGRLDHYARLVTDAGHPAPHRFDPEALADAIARERVDRVIVTTPDHTHARFIEAALEGGADVVTEKPLTTTDEGVRRIAAAVERTGRDVVITFNYRYSPRNAALRQAILDDRVGRPLSVHFEWLLDTAHGADYFRRWHREKPNSGGLLIHKASHHFDLVNWWLGTSPTRVFASASLRFYGAANARARGMGPHPARGTSDEPGKDRFSLDMRLDPGLRALYLDQEHHDGYLRDRDVFGEGITIEDDHSLVVDYATGASMAYTLSAHGPWEGYTVTVNGTSGRAELTVVERGAVLFGDDGRVLFDPMARPPGAAPDELRPVSERLLVQRHFERAEELPIATGAGAHGGGDTLLLRDVFEGVRDDPLGRAASWRDGVRSVAVGLAGNRSIDTGQAVRIEDLDLAPFKPVGASL
jgi:predicted dehydrogenase